jgi:hypothetical protein
MSDTDNYTPKPAESGPQVDLEAIETRLKDISIGTWGFREAETFPLYRNSGGFSYDLMRFEFVYDDDARYVEFVNRADGEFIANAPTDIARLIAEVRRLRSELAELKAEDELWWNSHHE